MLEILEGHIRGTAWSTIGEKPPSETRCGTLDITSFSTSCLVHSSRNARLSMLPISNTSLPYKLSLFEQIKGGGQIE